MPAKAKLTIVLKADNTVVAETEDAVLWQRVLAAINGVGVEGRKTAQDDLKEFEEDSDSSKEVGQNLSAFAKQLGVKHETLVGALSPSNEAPYLQLNSHNWEAFKKNFPNRGPGSVSPIGLAGTALALWFKAAKLQVSPTQALASNVLDTIDVKDPNPSRGIKNTKWLQRRAGGTIVLNPAEITKAQEVVKLFCEKKAPE